MKNASHQKREIIGTSYDELSAYLKSIKEKAYRTDQIFDWIYKKDARSFDCMTNLSAELIWQLKSDFSFSQISPSNTFVSKDKTVKFLLSLNDGQTIETVLIPTKTRATVCVSTQVGCKFHCSFCASGLNGFKRNLQVWEIVYQVLSVRNYFKERSLTHIVFMGIGEPFDNYDNLIKAIRILNDKHGINIAARRMTISTCGLPSKINDFKKENIQVELSISLHGPNDTIRNKLMPVNKRYPLSSLVQTCREYIRKTKRQITFEYILIKNVTCTKSAAQELGKLLGGMTCKINLIPYNEVAQFNYQSVSKDEMASFQKALKKYGVHSTLRMPRGRDIGAACGQLRYEGAKHAKK